ncbi:MAG: SufD family Fe-S cluster assembly protein [Candidatus Woesearchaeota archaeon]
MDYSNDFQLLLEAYKKAGGKPSFLKNPEVAFLLVKENKILGKNQIRGIVLKGIEDPDGVTLKMRVKKGVKLQNPIHFCFGIIPKSGVQKVNVEVVLEEGSSAEILAHCTFPNALRVKHLMNGRFIVKKGASLTYNETHFHGNTGGIIVRPNILVKVGDGASYKTLFSLTKGRVGVLDINYRTEAGANSTVEMEAKSLGYEDDKIRIREEAILLGRNAKSLIKTRVGLRDRAVSDVYNVTEGNAPNVRGHVDCIEIVSGNAKATATPIVSVSDETARVTHEAAIGSVDRKQLDTLMAHGLSKKDAIETILQAMLK